MRLQTVGHVARVLGAGLSLLWAGTMKAQQRTGQEPTVQRIIGLSYPRLANLAAVQGTVDLVARISAEGVVESVRVISGQKLLVDSAREALLRWRFRCPSGSKRCEARITFAFRLLDKVCVEAACSSELQIDLPNTVIVQAKRLRAIAD
jgi:TonB family protein